MGSHETVLVVAEVHSYHHGVVHNIAGIQVFPQLLIAATYQLRYPWTDPRLALPTWAEPNAVRKQKRKA